MTRSRIALGLLLACPVALYTTVKPPHEIRSRVTGPTAPAAYFPTAVGTRWVYTVTHHGIVRKKEPFDEIEVVTAVTARDGEQFVTVEQLAGDAPYRFHEYALSDAGLRCRSLPDPKQRYPSGTEPSPGMWITHLPMRLAPGETWTCARPGDSTQTVCTIAGWEPVSVSAGDYLALRVNIESTQYEYKTGKLLGTISGSFWHAPGIGVVKMTVMIDVIPFRATRELVSFTPGRR